MIRLPSTRPSPEELASRLRALEREHWALKGLFLGALVLAAAIGAGGEPPKALEVQEILLKDAEGHTRLRLGLSETTYAVPPSTPPATGPQDPLDLLDKQKGQKDHVKEVKVSSTCLTFFASDGSPASMQCSTWEGAAQTYLQVRHGRRVGARLSVDGDGSSFGLGNLRSRRNPEDVGSLSMAASPQGAWLRIAGPPERETVLSTDALTIGERGKPPQAFPAGAKHREPE